MSLSRPPDTATIATHADHDLRPPGQRQDHRGPAARAAARAAAHLRRRSVPPGGGASAALSLDAVQRAVASRIIRIDRALDAKMAEYARQGDVVLEGRLAGFIALQEGADALKVWLDRQRRGARAAGGAARGPRLARRCCELNRARQRSDAKRYHDDLRLRSRRHVDLRSDPGQRRPDARRRSPSRFCARAAERFGRDARRGDEPRTT